MRFKRPSRRTSILTIISIAIVLAAGVYTWQSLSYWKSYEVQLTSERAEYTRLKDAALGKGTSEDRLKAVRALDDKLATRGTLCDTHALFMWQATVIPVIRDGVATCKASVRKLDVVAAPLHGLREYLDTTQKVQESVVKLAPKGNFTDTNWTNDGLERAQTVRSDLEKMSASGDGEELKSQAINATDKVIQAWEALIKANEAKDKAAFLSASAAVATGYADFAGLIDTADSGIKSKVSEVLEAAKQL